MDINNGKLKLIEVLLSTSLNFEFILFSLNKLISTVKVKDFKKAKVKSIDGYFPFIIGLY